MARQRTQREVSEAVQSLFRVRAAESDPDRDGLIQVWHQGMKGADLLSFVNDVGHVTRQEFTLYETFLEWTSTKGVRTGTVQTGGGAHAGASDAVRFDYELLPSRVFAANQALSTYAGQDKYILHIKTVCERVLSGLDIREEKTVTRVRGFSSAKTEIMSRPGVLKLLWLRLRSLRGR